MYGAVMIDVAGTSLSNEDKELLSKQEVGGIILFGRNIDTPNQVRALCDDIRQVKPNILIGVDQEGGRVARLRDGFTPLPAMGQIGAMFNKHPNDALSLSYDCGYLMACEVMAVGIDISFAPVLDINGLSRVIGDRSFHARTEAIVALASQFMRGMKAAGMATTGKHFPGHGSIAPDSHVADAIDDRPYEAIKHNDLQPFIQCLPLLDAMMPAHVIFSAVDDKPAGFSKVWLQDIAREQMGFDGVLFSDDLSMKAAQVIGGVEARVEAALSAGCDMALVCNDRRAAKCALNEACKLPSPNQDRIAQMQSQLPKWHDTFQDTCSTYPYWHTARQNILTQFFSTSINHRLQVSNPSNESSHILNDPTNYQL